MTDEVEYIDKEFAMKSLKKFMEENKELLDDLASLNQNYTNDGGKK